MITTVVAGNPKPASRTLDAATVVLERLTGRAPDHVVDVIDLGAGLLGWGDTAVRLPSHLAGARFDDILSERPVAGGSALRLSEVLATLPVALLLAD